MRDVKDVDVKKLREAIASLNGANILEEKLVVKGKTIDDMMDELVTAVETLDDTQASELPEKVILMYNSLIEDEIQEEGEPAAEVEEEIEAKVEEKEAGVEETEITPEDEKVAEEVFEEKKKVEEAEKAESVKEKKGAPFAAKKDTSKVMVYISELISEGKHKRKDIINKVRARFPDRTVAAIGTYISDGKNEKYCKFDRLVVTSENDILRFVK